MTMNRRTLPTLAVLSLLFGAVVMGCHAEEAGANNNHLGTCTVDGDCTGGETCFNCPSDCCTQCSLQTITPAQPRDFLVSELKWPLDYDESKRFALDLDGDGEPDNKVGYVMGVLAAADAQFNGYIARRIASGDLMLVLRVWVDDLDADEVVAVQLLPAVTADATPQFDGLDRVRIASASPSDRFACGAVSGGWLLTDPARETQPLPSPMGKVINDWMRYHRLRFSGELSAAQLTDVVVAGAIDEHDTQHVLFPDIAALLNEEILANPDNAIVDLLEDLFDGQCDRNLPGCEGVVAGQGACDDTANPPVITDTELRCNAVMHAVTQPDLDSDGDGVKDLLSGAWRISAVPVTVVD